MTAFDAGAYLDADERLSTFAARFPWDARSEDAAFLRAVIATKRGDAAASVARARDYLKRFPRGLRRAEMERLVKAPW
jgi:outer membrane protein assembly factor BamD (BamD/ComL family)